MINVVIICFVCKKQFDVSLTLYQYDWMCQIKLKIAFESRRFLERWHLATPFNGLNGKFKIANDDDKKEEEKKEKNK